MPNAKRRVQVRRAKTGASDPIERARQAGIKEGKAQAKADYKKAERAAVARAKADERAVRDEAMARMEKEIEDLTERCRALERRSTTVGEDRKPRREKADKWIKQHETKEWIAPFNEEDTQEVRQRRPQFQGDDPALEPGRDARRRSSLDRS